MQKQVYRVVPTEGAWIFGQFKPSGNRVSLFQPQAQHLINAGVLALDTSGSPGASLPQPPRPVKAR